MIYMPALKTRNPFSGSVSGRYGLNELLDSYQKALNKQTVMRLAPTLIIPGLFLAREPGSFFACLALTAFGSLLMRRSYSAERRVSADYRKESEYLVSGIGDGKSALTLLEKLDGEVRRGDMILRSANNDYYLFPSAIVADKGGTAVRPWIVPTDKAASMTCTSPSSGGRFYFVYLYDEHKRALGAVRFNNQKSASTLMSELSRRFGVQDSA